MTPSFRITLFMLFGVPWYGFAHPQTASPQARGSAHVSLGQSAVPLYGPWKFQVGDSPLDPATHAPLWAEPEFDDSKWEDVDLMPKTGSIDPVAGLSGYVPGWTTKGHVRYWGFAWYRIEVRLQDRPGATLALVGPPDVDDVYQIFDNGEMIGSFGDFIGERPVVYYTRPMMFPLPQSGSYGAGDDPGWSVHILAFRVWMAPSTLTSTPDAGGFHSAPVLGESGTVTAVYQVRWLELIRLYAPWAVEAMLDVLLAMVALSLILFDRSDRVYLWMAALFLLTATYNALAAFDTWSQHISVLGDLLLRDCLLTPMLYAGWVMVWWVWFGRQRPAWLPGAVAGLALLYMISNAIGEELFFALVPHPVATAFHMVSLIVRLLFFALLAWIVIQGIRLQGLEGWLVLPAVVLREIGMFQDELTVLHIQVVWFPFGVRINLVQITYLLLVVVLILLLLRRLMISVHTQRRLALDVRHAQEVQQVILPQARTILPGFVIESEYRPALEVGGDFFQIIPHPTDGSVLIVAGDVTGKGLKAGMLVALLVGAIHSTAETDTEPEHILAALNRRLLGRADAQATCLALRITQNGEVTMANAGHLPPYLNGEAMTVEGALPLGMISEADFTVLHFKLTEGDRLVMISDGIVEATNLQGHLLGFERVQELLRTTSSAAEVASAAQSFGQEDDISIIAVTRTAMLEFAAA